MQFRLHIVRSLAAILLSISCWFAALPAGAASSSGSVVGATVPSATTIDASGCPATSPGITDFGLLVPGSSAVTTADCTVLFGSSNDTSMLRLAQRDSGGDAMVAGPTSGAGVLGYWPMNGTRDDVSATGNAIGVLPANPNDPSFDANAPAGRGQSLYFDGDDYATIPYHSGYDVTSFTVDLWFRTTDSLGIIASRQAVNSCGSGFNTPCQWEFWLTGGRVEANIQVGTTEYTISSLGAVNDNTWHHAAMTVDDATKLQRFYIDGTLQGSSTSWTSGSVHVDGNQPIWLGDNAMIVDSYTGRLDELRFQSGARTASEIRSYYAGRVQDYANSTNDWTSTAATTRMFGACLRAASGGAATGAGTWTANATCPATNGAYWNAVAPTTAAAGAKVATAPLATTAARVDLRFGVRIPQSQAPGLYTAPIAFEVVAPEA